MKSGFRKNSRLYLIFFSFTRILPRGIITAADEIHAKVSSKSENFRNNYFIIILIKQVGFKEVLIGKITLGRHSRCCIGITRGQMRFRSANL